MTTSRLTKNTHLTNVQTCISSPLFTVIILPSECGHLTLHPRCQVIWHSDLWRMPGWLSWALSSDTRPPSAAEAHLWPWDVGLTPDPDPGAQVTADDGWGEIQDSEIFLHMPIACCSQKMKYSPRSGFCWNVRPLSGPGQATQGDGVIHSNTMLCNP